MTTAQRRWVKENPVKVKDIARRCYLKSRAKNREEIFRVLGRVCIQCGFDNWRALHVDHINGGGNAERRNNNGESIRSRAKLVRNNPEKYQILCANCNFIKESLRREPEVFK